jgi:small-conductance mechanosensitive channel
VEQALTRAAEDAGLEEPFVHVLELNDFSVSYRVAGLLTDVKSLLSTRSRLRSLMLDRLHEAGIEIVSPTFMNQRAITPEKCFIPEAAPASTVQTEPEVPPEAVVFDKADEAESLEKLRDRHKKMLEDMTGLKESRDKAADPDEKDRLAAEIELLGERAERLATYIDERKRQKE